MACRTSANSGGDAARHALRGRIGGDQFGVRGFERTQLVHEPVVLGVRHRRLVEHVVAVIVAVDFIAQLRDALRCTAAPAMISSRRRRAPGGRLERLAQTRDALRA